jgi:hypothetical protein
LSSFESNGILKDKKIKSDQFVVFKLSKGFPKMGGAAIIWKKLAIKEILFVVNLTNGTILEFREIQSF